MKEIGSIKRAQKPWKLFMKRLRNCPICGRSAPFIRDVEDLLKEDDEL